MRARTAGDGADHAFDCVGSAETIRRCWAATRRGGRTTVVGIGGANERVTSTSLEIFHYARTLSGCVFGNSRPDQDVPHLVGLVASGRLVPSDLVVARIGLADVPRALAGPGAGGRTLIEF